MNTFFIFLFFPLLLLALPSVSAHCPLCTGAVGVAAVSAGYYGIDMSIIGLFVGAFGISTGLWMARKVGKYTTLIVLASVFLTLFPLRMVSNETFFLPLLFLGPAGTFLNKVYWVNKFLFGGVLGSIVTSAAFWIHMTIKRFHGRVLFPFQGVALTLLFLAVAGIGLYAGVLYG